MANLPRTMTLQTHPSPASDTSRPSSHHNGTPVEHISCPRSGDHPVPLPPDHHHHRAPIRPHRHGAGCAIPQRLHVGYDSRGRCLCTREAVSTHPTGRRVGVFRLCGGGGAACRPRRRRAAVAIPEQRYVAQRLGLVPLGCTGRWRLDDVGQLGSMDGSGSLYVLDFGADSGDEDLHCSSYRIEERIGRATR